MKILREASKREAARAKRKSAGTHGIVLVTSAIGHTTRHLARAAELAEEGRLSEAEESLARIIEQHKQLAISLRIEADDRLFSRLDSTANEIEGWFEGVAIVRELSPRTRDAILAAGERLASALIEAVLRDRKFPVHALPAASSIVTDEQFGHAHPILEQIELHAQKLIVPQLRKGNIVIIEGFSGATMEGITTTMGTESSDLTATLLARVLDAEEVVIWKVLPGLYTADPELVKTPKLIRSLSFDEAEEIGRRGSRILFPSFAHPLLSRNILLRIATPFGHLSRHTKLQREAAATRKTSPLALALESRLVPISIQKNNSSAKLRSKFTSSEVLLQRSVVSWTSSDEIHALVRREELRSAARSLSSPDTRITQSEPVAALSLIVRRATPDDVSTLVAQIARSLKSFHLHGILNYERSLIALIDEDEALAALRKLHHDIFGS